jgi:ATP-dependent protease ClpP protease subunit
MVEKDTARVRYLSPEEGVDYGIIDKVLYPEELRVEVIGERAFA